MSDIAGIINLNHTVQASAQDLKSMLKAMAPLVKTDKIGMTGMHTVAMPDGSAAAGKTVCSEQSYEKEACDIFMVGEIYNDAVFKGDSPETFLLKRYRTLGAENFAKGVNGSFSAVIMDHANKTVLLVTDHMNSCPLYFAIIRDQLFFASQVKGLLAVESIPREPDTKALFSLSTAGCILGRETICKSIKKMDYATVCRIKNERIDHIPYWRFTIDPEDDKGKSHYLDGMSDHIRTAVKRQTPQGESIAVMLSGGYDSRGILAAMADVKSVQAISLTSGRSDNALGDCAVAKKIAAYLEIDFSTMRYDASNFEKAMQESVYASDGAAGFVFENVWQDIRRKTKARTLIFGDTSMLGSKDRLTRHDDIPDLLELSVLSRMTFLAPFINPCFSNEFAIHAENISHALMQGAKDKNRWDSFYELYYENRLIHFLLPRRKIITGHGLNVRNPLLDLDLINFVRILPVKYRKEKLLFKQCVLTINPSLLNIPLADKNETINYHPFLAKAEQDYSSISTLFFNDNPLFNHYFNDRAMKALVKKVTDSSSGTCHTSKTHSNNFRRMIPRPVKKILRNFWHARPMCNDVQLLLNMMAVAMTLKHFYHFKGEKIGMEKAPDCFRSAKAV